MWEVGYSWRVAGAASCEKMEKPGAGSPYLGGSRGAVRVTLLICYESNRLYSSARALW